MGGWESVCCHKDITSMTRITHSALSQSFGGTAQVITKQQKTLMIWLGIDCVCVCFFGWFGSHPLGSRTGNLKIKVANVFVLLAK